MLGVLNPPTIADKAVFVAIGLAMVFGYGLAVFILLKLWRWLRGARRRDRHSAPADKVW